MGPDENASQQPSAFDLEELRLRIDRLEREVAALRQQDPPFIVAPPPPPPRAVTVPPSVSVAPADITPPPPVPKPPKASLENRLGSQIFNRIGIVALLIGTTWFLKLAIDNHWIGPVGRILIGLIAGAGLILWSERFRRQGIRAFSYSLKAVGTGVLYLSLWAAFQLYHLLPASVAFGAMLLVTVWNAFMAWSQDAELLAGYALIGAVATPALLSTGSNHEVFLFTYLLAIDLATAVLIRLKSWPRLVLGIFPATVAYFIVWYGDYFAPPELVTTSLFLVLFGLTFLSISIDRALTARRPFEGYLADIFLPLGNATFVALGFYCLLDRSGHHAFLPWLMLILAAAYLGIMRLPQRRVAAALHLSLAVVFLTIAIPLKASGHWITAAWLVEGVALYWVSTRLAHEEAVTELHDDTVLHWLASAALLLGFVAICASSYWFNLSIHERFFNHDLATALLGIASFSAIAWLASRANKSATNSAPAALIALILVDTLSLLLALREITASYTQASARGAFFNADFATALLGIGVLAAVAFVTLRIARARQHPRAWREFAAASIVALNLVAILSGVQEIHALWTDNASSVNAELKQALAVSAFLMAYSALLLAIGFWKRTAFIRWQGLILLVFTIAKTFLHDMSSLSQGYRVVSFLGLGVLLMAVSFAYQKDWLSLREPAPPAPDTVPNVEEPQP
jgi:uncharacterized membrane protein